MMSREREILGGGGGGWGNKIFYGLHHREGQA